MWVYRELLLAAVIRWGELPGCWVASIQGILPPTLPSSDSYHCEARSRAIDTQPLATTAKWLLVAFYLLLPTWQATARWAVVDHAFTSYVRSFTIWKALIESVSWRGVGISLLLLCHWLLVWDRYSTLFLAPTSEL